VNRGPTTDDRRPATRAQRALPAEVLIAFGGNVGDPVAQIAAAVESLRAAVRWRAFSPVYRTEPVGHRKQPDFFNVVGAGWTQLAARELLHAALEVEAVLGRRRTFANAPRPIDIDLLAYDDLVLDTPELALPHPRLHQRGFVLFPLAAVAPGWRHPVLRRTAAELLAGAGPLERVERWGELPVSP
jgi:2-amino-4-hydroxy-6-hydroxymethyldihydropteridine diphosphokinase